MELYVFVHVGGGREAIDVRPLEGSESLANSLRTFDAAKAKCFLDTDRQRLWAVIETSFGTFTPFNEIVRGIFAERLGQEVPLWGAKSSSSSMVHVEMTAA